MKGQLLLGQIIFPFLARYVKKNTKYKETFFVYLQIHVPQEFLKSESSPNHTISADRTVLEISCIRAQILHPTLLT